MNNLSALGDVSDGLHKVNSQPGEFDDNFVIWNPSTPVPSGSLNVTKRPSYPTFFGGEIPPYAILSHRWGDCEVLFQDVERDDVAQSNVNIAGFCAQALEDGGLIDSCCIDKSSSSELSEAINSMFRWYQDAQICYVYLSDVTCTGTCTIPDLEDLRKSAWFTRAWTLQELLGSEIIVFYNQGWNDLGTKATLENEIRAITQITHLFNFPEASIAQKMSWASARTTTRIEDEVYYLMGLFNVNMPILYGEGSNAFLRLQEEIIKKSDDESIFAWYSNSCNELRGMLAARPYEFASCGDIVTVATKDNSIFPYEMTNKGLRIQLQLTRFIPRGGNRSQPDTKPRKTMDFCTSILRCRRGFEEQLFEIYVIKHLTSPDTYCRKDVSYKYPLFITPVLDEPLEPLKRTIYVQAPKMTYTAKSCNFWINTKAIIDRGYQVAQVHDSTFLDYRQEGTKPAPFVINTTSFLGKESWVLFHGNSSP